MTRRLAGVCGFFAGLLLLLSAAGLRAQDAATYAEELVSRAEAQRLYVDPTWLHLLHAEPRWLGGFKSRVDDPRFFNAPHGKVDPRAEMAATLRAFFQSPGTNDLAHPACRFVARYAWLRDRLQIDSSRLPVPACKRFDQVREYLGATSVTLVFPAAYMNGPASMFGHTLLVFDAEGKNRLLSRAVSYAAKTDQRIGPLFAFAGIAGLYPGYYAIQPYYEKVEQYGDIGHRDVWEYELKFTPAEVDAMIRHAWELQGIWSRYFFFGENCAYNLYYFLEVARPELALSDKRDWFVIPIDTVKAIADAGLVGKVQYRPSPVTKIKHLAALLPKPARRLARDIARGRAPPGAATNDAVQITNRVAVLELASQYTQYLYTEERLPREKYQAQLMDTLRLRSRLGALPESFARVPEPTRPDSGHAPLRASLGAGMDDGGGFASARGRIAYHALLDNDTGYTPGAAIQFGNTEVRHYWERGETRLEQFDVVEVESIAPRDEFFHPGSWKFNMGLVQAHLAPDADDLLFQAQTGAGLAYRPRPSALCYAWIEARGLAGPALADSDLALGAGPAAGLLTGAGPRWKHMLEGRATYYAVGTEFWDLQAAWAQDFRLSQNRSVSLEFTAARRDHEDRAEAHLRFNGYF